MFQGKPKAVHLQPIADRIKTKLATWKGALLSIMGRLQLVNSIIQGKLLYSFHIYSWPVSLLKSVDRWVRNIVWSGDIHTKNVITVAWHKVCVPFNEGGLGLRSLRSINDAAILKLSWDFKSSKDSWACLVRARVLKQRKPVAYHIRSSIRHSIKRFLNVVDSNSLSWLVMVSASAFG